MHSYPLQVLILWHNANFGCFVQAIAQMQSALESLTAAAQSQTQMDASELAFQKNVHKLSALQSAQNVQNFERCSSNSMEYTKQVT